MGRFKDKIIRGVSNFSQDFPWLKKKINHLAINLSVNVCRHRPHPWSTVQPYVSWQSLTDREWSARHQPAKQLFPPKNDNIKGLFKRESFQPCHKSTCLFPAFAQYLTDGFIRTKMPKKEEPQEDRERKRKQNTSNHEIDMSPLYGRTLEQTTALRLFSNEPGQKGRLKSQTLYGEEYAPFLFDNGVLKEEFKILDLPLMSEDLMADADLVSKLFAFGGDRANSSPHIAMMNTLYLREHNRLAGLIEEESSEWEDEQLFQVARNTVIVLFIKIVVDEYINHISPSIKFETDPSVAWDAPWNKPNWITTEFSLLYRWHSLMPDAFEWGNKSYQLDQIIMNNAPLLDNGLKEAFVDMSAQRAGKVGAFNTAVALLPMEINAINQGRICELASYGDYREYVSLSRPASFSDVSTNPKVVEFLKQAYESVEDIEFYPGLFAEEIDSKSPLPELLRTLVAADAFSQALTNPLLSRHVWKESTFSKAGWKAIHDTKCTRDILARNVTGGLDDSVFIGMTRQGYSI